MSDVEIEVATPLIASRAVKVVFFEDRAEVTRRAALRVKKGRQTLEIGGLAAVTDDTSLRASVPEVLVLGARVRRRYVLDEDKRREEATGAAAELRAIGEKIGVLRDRERRKGLHGNRMLRLIDEWAKAIAKVPREATPETLAPWRTAVTDAIAALTEVARTETAIGAEARGLERELERLKRRYAALDVEQPRLETLVELELLAEDDAEREVELRYRVPCALWRPEHFAHLVQDAAPHIELQTFGTIWQITGETWADVEVELSTARSRGATTLPKLDDDVISSRKKTDDEKSRVVIEARDEAIVVTGAAGGRNRVDEMPGVDDGGEPRVFRAKERVTIPSNGLPFRVEIGRTTAPAKVSRVVLAERDPRAFFRAVATLGGAHPLLAGPLRIARGDSYVGLTRMDFVAPGEGFELGFGPDDGVRVRRSVAEKREETMITGTQKIERTVDLFLSNLSSERRSVVVTERVPVSEIEAVKIQMKDVGGFSAPDADGIIRRAVEIDPRNTLKLAFKYEITAKSNVALPF